MNAAGTEPVSPGQPLSGPPVRVVARDLTRRYGDAGDTAVHALRGVSVTAHEGERLMPANGPSGSWCKLAPACTCSPGWTGRPPATSGSPARRSRRSATTR